MTTEQLTAFQQAAGTTAPHASLVIRMIILASVMMWSAWIIYAQIRALGHHSMEWFDIVKIACHVSIIVLVMGWVMSN